MGNLRACFAVALLALAACGEDHAKVDASIIIQDSPPIDSKVFMDAPPSMYDLSCLGANPPTTAADPITIGGTTQTLTMNGAMPLAMVAVDVFRSSSATAIASVTSDNAGAFMTGNIATGGTPVDGYVRGAKATFRTTYLYPPTVVATSLPGVPVILISNALFDALSAQIAPQDDANNGALLVLVTDCTVPQPSPIEGATLSVQQGGSDVGTVFDLGGLAPQAAGTFFVFNVPDGATQVTASYNSMMFPTRTVVAHKKPMGMNTEATLTVVAVRPGG
ncbi:MAG TPA: hypothetical protein VIV11_30465 [Kofleriaceae bacterium]